MMYKELEKQALNLVQTYNAQLAGAWPGNENKTLDKLEEVCNSYGVSKESVIDYIEVKYYGA